MSEPKPGQTLYYQGHRWTTPNGGKSSVKCGPFESSQEADDALVRMLKGSGYKPPKWWEVSRWGEHVPDAWKKANR